MNVSAPFKSVGHFFATVFQKVEAAIPKIQASEATVEAVTATIPVYGPLALTAEKAAYAILGEVGAVLHVGGDAVKAKLTDAGLDESVIATIEALVKSIPQYTALVKAAA